MTAFELFGHEGQGEPEVRLREEGPADHVLRGARSRAHQAQRRAEARERRAVARPQRLPALRPPGGYAGGGRLRHPEPRVARDSLALAPRRGASARSAPRRSRSSPRRLRHRVRARPPTPSCATACRAWPSWAPSSAARPWPSRKAWTRSDLFDGITHPDRGQVRQAAASGWWTTTCASSVAATTRSRRSPPTWRSGADESKAAPGSTPAEPHGHARRRSRHRRTRAASSSRCAPCAPWGRTASPIRTPRVAPFPRPPSTVRDMTNIRFEVPDFIAEKCTGCSQCWIQCPDAAIPGLVPLGRGSASTRPSARRPTESPIDRVKQIAKHLAQGVAEDHEGRALQDLRRRGHARRTPTWWRSSDGTPTGVPSSTVSGPGSSRFWSSSRWPRRRPSTTCPRARRRTPADCWPSRSIPRRARGATSAWTSAPSTRWSRCSRTTPSSSRSAPELEVLGAAPRHGRPLHQHP